MLLLYRVTLATLMTMAVPMPMPMTLTAATLQRHWQRNCNVAALYVVVIAYLPRKLHLIELFARISTHTHLRTLHINVYKYIFFVASFRIRKCS